MSTRRKERNFSNFDIHDDLIEGCFRKILAPSASEWRVNVSRFKLRLYETIRMGVAKAYPLLLFQNNTYPI